MQVFNSIHELEPETWDQIVAGRGFQSHRWYAFGERAMSDSPPTYLIANQNEKPIAAAALFRIHNEPLPVPTLAQNFMDAIFRRNPMLICRSPLADASGLLLPDSPFRSEVLSAITSAAQNELRQQHGSFLLFDFLPIEELHWREWHPDFSSFTVSDPGTSMRLAHESFEAYLAADKKTRNDYHHTLRKAEETGLQLTRHTRVDDVETALKLIHHVSRKHNSLPNPWMRGLLENLPMIDATWFEIHQGDKLVGCIVTMRDNETQIATALGLEPDLPFAYFMLIYASIKEAFDRQVKRFRLGSGAYEVKRRLGFQLENTNHTMVTTPGLTSRTLVRLASKAGSWSAGNTRAP